MSGAHEWSCGPAISPDKCRLLWSRSAEVGPLEQIGSYLGYPDVLANLAERAALDPKEAA
jgi:hypothetical protein